MNEPQAPPPPPSSPPPPPSAPPPASPPPASGGGSENRGLMVALSYLWLLALIPLLVEKEDAEVQWHAKHGLTLLVAEVLVGIGFMVLGVVLSFVDFLGCIVGILNMVFFLAVLVLHVACILKGVKGERLLVPGVSQYADRF